MHHGSHTLKDTQTAMMAALLALLSKWATLPLATLRRGGLTSSEFSGASTPTRQEQPGASLAQAASSSNI